MQLQNFYRNVIKHRKAVIVFFLLAAVICAMLTPMVGVQYDMMAYLPEQSPSTIAISTLEEEYQLSIPNCRVMVRDLSVPEALHLKTQLAAVDGVSQVTWLDDSVSMLEPLAMQKKTTVEEWYIDETAVFSLTLEKEKQKEAVHSIEAIIGEDGVMTGTAVNNVASQESASKEVASIMTIVVPFCVVLLALVSVSWLDPLLFLGTIGIAILLNMGTNLVFGEISFVTKIAGSVLQLAVSLDYSLFLMHRFEECRKETDNPEDAMLDALCKATPSILSSGLTTVVGFAVLMVMEFGIGADLGRVLAKGIAFSLIAVLILLPAITLCSLKWIDKLSHRPLIPRVTFLGKLVLKSRNIAIVVFLILIVPVFLAQGSNSFYYGSSRMFGPDTVQGQQSAEVEEVFGQSNTFVLLVPNGDLPRESALNTELQQMREVTSVVSYVNTVGSEIPMEYLDANVLSQLVSENYSCMLITAQVPAEGVEAFFFVQRLEQLAGEYYPGTYHLAGDTPSTFDLKDTVESDQMRVNLLVIAAIFLILMLTLKSVLLPLLLMLVIETSVWINLSVPYFADETLFYIAYLIISSIQLGATVDYAILMGTRYQE
ncbi:MAG: MMPL family transporter, partial [Peptococcaceae bacterium]|nr:MMPL family transporter [Peptococcaceae bacterium]